MALLAAVALPASAAAAGKGAAERPNVVVVTTDDQTASSMSERTMPFTTRFFAERGTDLRNAVVVSPTCCPSRAAYLTGQYPHNNGVFNNSPGYGALRQKANTLPNWLKRAGYRTAHIGKFLNGYGPARGLKRPAPGFQRWYTLAGTYRYTGYNLAAGGRIRTFGSLPRDFLTRRLNRRAATFLERNTARRRPVYLQLDHLAPHSETSFTPGRCEHAAQPDPVDLDRFVHEPLPQDRLPQGARSYDEADLSDKSSAVSSLPRLDAAARAQILRRYRCQLASLRSVDRGFRQLVRALGRTGSLRDTAVVFTSDNGFFHGEHRLQRNKGYPYEEAIRVPLLIRLPPAAGIGSRTTVGSPVANIDITATILELAGAQSCKGPRRCRILDGRSLLPLIARGPSDWPDDRAILIEQERHEYLCAAFAAIWRPAEMLARYPTPTGPGGACSPEHEHYETARDPMQLENAFPAAAGSSGRERQADLLGELSRLRRCAGVAGRDERSGGRPFCE